MTNKNAIHMLVKFSYMLATVNTAVIRKRTIKNDILRLIGDAAFCNEKIKYV